MWSEDASALIKLQCGPFELGTTRLITSFSFFGSGRGGTHSPGTIGSPSQYQIPSSWFKNRMALSGTGGASRTASQLECSRLTSASRGSDARFFHSWGSLRWSYSSSVPSA